MNQYEWHNLLRYKWHNLNRYEWHNLLRFGWHTLERFIQMCENLVEVVFLKELLDNLSCKLRPIVISDFHMDASI